MKRINWTRDELIIAFSLYLKIPFGKIHHSNPEIISLANLLGRTPSSIAIRLSNFAHVDPYHRDRGVVGMSAGANVVQPIWDEFIQDKESLLFESERIRAEKENSTIENKYASILEGTAHLEGESRIQEIKVRVNQDVFRQIVLNNYNSKCALTGIDIPDLLIASHIIPWSKNVHERLNPENGLCLSALYDRAFDRGLIGFNSNLEVVFSDQLKAKHKAPFFQKHFGDIEGKQLDSAVKYSPRIEFLDYHMMSIFRR